MDALLRLVNRLGRRASPQSIANALWGAGRLAEAGHHTGEISAQNVGDLLVRLSQNDRVKPQEIANALWGAGRLAEAGHHTGEISAQNVGDLLVRLSQNDRVKPQEIANALYGIAKLMPKQKLSDELMIAMNSSVDTLLSMKDPRRAANVSVCAHVLFKMHGKLSKEVESMLIKDRPRPLPIQENLVKLLAQNFQGSRPEAEKLVGSWFVDVQFTYQGKKYIVEIDGKQHYDEERKLMPKDVARDNALQEMGYYVFRYSNRLSADKIIEQLIAKIKASERLAGQDSDRVTLSPLTAAEQKTMVGENGAVDSCQEGSGLALGPRQPQRKKKKPNPKEERVADFSSPASQSFFQQAYGDSHSTGASASGTAAKLNRGRTG